MNNTIEQFNAEIKAKILEDEILTLTNNRIIKRDSENKQLTIKAGFDKILALVSTSCSK
tara:strand:+ start:26357 stop:26533 length:177 start_codon:yes stop_codon:yes gene_type:complete